MNLESKVMTRWRRGYGESKSLGAELDLASVLSHLLSYFINSTSYVLVTLSTTSNDVKGFAVKLFPSLR